MESSKFIGTGWKDESGITITIKVAELQKLVETGEYPVNNYGEVRVRVGKLQKPNEKSKATHFVRMYQYKPEF